MHILLTDLLVCPRCGPAHGLLLLADRVEDRRVIEGTLGCANCRDRYPIRGGFADLRPRPAPPLGPAEPPEPGTGPVAFRLAALMGIAEGPGFSLIVGPGARFAPAVAAMIERLEIVAADSALAGWPEESGVNRLAVGPGLPFHSGSIRAVALGAEAADAHLEEGARVLAPLGRLVLEDAPADAQVRVRAAGLEVLAVEPGTLVAARR